MPDERVDGYQLAAMLSKQLEAKAHRLKAMDHVFLAEQSEQEARGMDAAIRKANGLGEGDSYDTATGAVVRKAP